MKKFVIQWRKFDFKKSCIFKDMEFWIFKDFSRIFNLIFIDFIPYFKSQKGGFYPQESRVDVTRDLRGCDVARKATC